MANKPPNLTESSRVAILDELSAAIREALPVEPVVTRSLYSRRNGQRRQGSRPRPMGGSDAPAVPRFSVAVLPVAAGEAAYGAIMEKAT